MFRATVIGNLGADAHVEQNNGRPFVSFKVAHNDRYTKEDGTIVENLQWISCALNGDGGALLQHLKKGRQVYVEGRCSVRVFSSEKERRMVAGVNLSVDHLELIGGKVDEVPSRLFDTQGVMHDVHKSYWISEQEAQAILGGYEKSILQNASGQQFVLQRPCWVTPVDNQETPGTQQEQVEVFDGEEKDAETKALQEKMSRANSRKK